MRQPRVAAAGVLAVVLAAAIAVALSSGSAGGDRDTGVRWADRPAVVPAPGLPRDGIVTGRIRNDSLERLELDAEDLVVVDDRGRRFRTAGRYMTGFAHGLWPPGQQVAVGSEAERERLGEIATLEPGEAAPLTVAWSRPRGAGRPVRIELGGPVLAIPARRPRL